MPMTDQLRHCGLLPNLNTAVMEIQIELFDFTEENVSGELLPAREASCTTLTGDLGWY